MLPQNIFTPNKLQGVKDRINKASSIVIVAHKSPDGDSIGSSLALYHFIKKFNQNVVICHPDPAPTFFTWLDGFDSILNYQNNKEKVKSEIQKSDLMFCLDFNALSRLGEDMSEMVKDSSAFKVMIDHHLHPTDEFDVVFSDTSSCSTAQLIFEFIEALDSLEMIDSKIGEPIYCGIMTDSGSFRYPSVTTKTHQVIAFLLEKGVNNAKVHESVFDTNTIERLRLRGYATNEKLTIVDKYNTAVLTLTEAELEQFGYQNGDTDGLVNVGLSIVGVNKSVFFKESNGIIKISFRSKGDDNPINELAAKYFNGGGHANAAGGRWEGEMNEAVEELKRVLHEFCD